MKTGIKALLATAAILLAGCNVNESKETTEPKKIKQTSSNNAALQKEIDRAHYAMSKEYAGTIPEFHKLSHHGFDGFCVSVFEAYAGEHSEIAKASSEKMPETYRNMDKNSKEFKEFEQGKSKGITFMETEPYDGIESAVADCEIYFAHYHYE